MVVMVVVHHGRIDGPSCANRYRQVVSDLPLVLDVGVILLSPFVQDVSASLLVAVRDAQEEISSGITRGKSPGSREVDIPHR